VERDWSVATKEFVAGEGEMRGRVKALKAVKLEWQDGKPREVPGSEFLLPAELVLLAMGFVSPLQSMLEEFGIEKDARGNARADTDGARAYLTSVPKVFAAGDVRRGQSLVVWAIREGRQCARSVDESLMGFSELPRQQRPDLLPGGRQQVELGGSITVHIRVVEHHALGAQAAQV